MKKWILIIIILIIFPNILHSVEQSIMKRHFFDLCFTTGFCYRFSEYVNKEWDINSKETEIGIGAVFGGAFGYQYAFNDYFAFGPGLFVFFSVMDLRDKTSYVDTGEIHYEDREVTPMNGSAGLSFLFMFGSLEKHKIAFLLDIGGGLLFIIKFGIYAKGFVFKIGFDIPGIFYTDAYENGIEIAYNIVIDIGYKFNWGKIKKLK